MPAQRLAGADYVTESEQRGWARSSISASAIAYAHSEKPMKPYMVQIPILSTPLHATGQAPTTANGRHSRISNPSCGTWSANTANIEACSTERARPARPTQHAYVKEAGMDGSFDGFAHSALGSGR